MRINMNDHIVIAIDGASASGKTTTSKMVAQALGFIHVDTGAMYRTLAWYCLKLGVDVYDSKAVVGLCNGWDAALRCENNCIYLVVDGYYPEKEIRASQVSAATPVVAASPQVRQWMKATQRRCLQFGNIVMEGRDIGAHIFPEAPFKFYLDASLTERARRRAAQGCTENIAVRDEHDTRRAAAPLKIAPEAIVINNSNQSPAETTHRILEHVKKALASV